MTGIHRLAGKLQSSSSAALRSTYALSLRLARASLRLLFLPLRPLLSPLFARGMDDLLASDDRLFGLDTDSSAGAGSGSGSRNDADHANGAEDDRGESIYLVPYRWWIETRNNVKEVVGTLYTTTSKEDSALQILLEMRRENYHKSDNKEEGFSVGEFALVPETTWLQTLKSHNDSIGVNDINTKSQMHDVFPLKIGLSVSQETKSLRARISLIVGYLFLATLLANGALSCKFMTALD